MKGKRERYRRILKKLPRLYRCSEYVYKEACRGKTGASQGKGQEAEQEEAWTAAFCYVMAPVLLSFVLWVLEKALESGKERLYFLSRDGYMMCLLADYFCKAWQLPLECRYLHCSRYALRSGEYKLLGEERLDYICLGGMKVTLGKMMRRGGLDGEEARTAGKCMGWEGDMDRLLSYGQVKALRPLLKGNAYFMDRLQAHSEKEYGKVAGYLRQEGLTEEVSCAIVDSGWTGSMQRSFRRLLESMGCGKEMEGYYFGMYEYAEGVNPELYHTWYFGPGDGNVKKAFFCNNLFECVFSSPEGMAKGYSKKDGRYVPVFAAAGNPNKKRIEEGAALLLRYAEHYGEQARRDGAGAGNGAVGGRRVFVPLPGLEGKEPARMRKTAARLLACFMGKPSEAEAMAFGRYVFDDDVTGEEKERIARAFTREEMQEGNILRRIGRYVCGKGPSAVQSAWPEAGIVLSPYAGSLDLVQTALYKFLLYARKSMEQKRKGKGKRLTTGAFTPGKTDMGDKHGHSD